MSEALPFPLDNWITCAGSLYVQHKYRASGNREQNTKKNSLFDGSYGKRRYLRRRRHSISLGAERSCVYAFVFNFSAYKGSCEPIMLKRIQKKNCLDTSGWRVHKCSVNHTL